MSDPRRMSPDRFARTVENWPTAAGKFVPHIEAIEAEVIRLREALAYEQHRHEADIRILTKGARNAGPFCDCALIGTPCDEAKRAALSSEGDTNG